MGLVAPYERYILPGLLFATFVSLNETLKNKIINIFFSSFTFILFISQILYILFIAIPTSKIYSADVKLLNSQGIKEEITTFYLLYAKDIDIKENKPFSAIPAVFPFDKLLYYNAIHRDIYCWVFPTGLILPLKEENTINSIKKLLEIKPKNVIVIGSEKKDLLDKIFESNSYKRISSGQTFNLYKALD